MKNERCLRLIQNGKLLSYEELLEKDWSVSVHHRNTQSLAIEMLQIKHSQSREFLTVFFYTGNTEKEFQQKSRLWDAFCENSVIIKACFYLNLKTDKKQKSLLYILKFFWNQALHSFNAEVIN